MYYVKGSEIYISNRYYNIINYRSVIIEICN